MRSISRNKTKPAIRQSEILKRRPNPLQNPNRNQNPNQDPNDGSRPRGGPSAEELEFETEVINEESSTENVEPSAPRRPYDEGGWNGDNWWLIDDPINLIGNPPGTSPDMIAGNGNFQMSAPVLALPGRGIDINLSLNYNSLLWSKTGSKMVYDSEKAIRRRAGA